MAPFAIAGVDAMLGEIMTTLGKTAWLIERASTCTLAGERRLEEHLLPSVLVADGESVLAPEARAASLTTLHKACRVEYAPIGVLGVIAPVGFL